MKKGFTLIELLAVLALLAILNMIIVPNVNSSIQSSRQKAYDSQVEIIIESAKKWAINNSDLLSTDDEYLLSLSTLIDENYVSNTENGKLKNPKDSKNPMDGCVYISYSDTYNQYLYEYKDECKTTPTKIYGVKRLISSSSTSWERIEDSVGLQANAQVGTKEVTNDFDSLYPWSDIISYNYDTTTNQITAYYGDDNFKFDGSNGEVLTKIPEFYYKRYQDDTYEYILISKKAKEGYTKSEEFSIGRYTISGDSSKVYSRSGVTPLTKTTITDFRTYARNLGTGFGIMDYHYFLIQMLYLVEYADYNSQAKLGSGYTSSSLTSPITSGGTDFLGMKSGSINGSATASIIYRGIEDIFGNVWQFIDGINIQNNQAYICYDQTQYASDTFTGCYQKIGYVNSSSEGYVSKLGYDPANPLVAFPIEVNGTNSTGTSDYYWQNSGNRIARVGGAWAYGTNAGLWFWSLADLSSNTNSNIGSRLIKTN
jgi:prepilin-type N-terminal cleavage/methylation domain-containing protein